MLDRPRIVMLAWSVGCLVAFAALTLAHDQWALLRELDASGRELASWALDVDGLAATLRVVEEATARIPMTVATLVLAAALFAKHHRRAAYFTLAVMLVTAVLTTLLKLAVGRVRPDWQATLQALETHSYPSGHSSSVAAFAAVCAVLVLMLVRRAAVRRIVYAAAVATVLVVGADRVLLGRHYPTDVLGGWLLGLAVVLLGLVVLNPLPRSIADSAPPMPEVFVSDKQLAVIVNPIKVEDMEAFQAVVTVLARESGWREPTWHFTRLDDTGTGMAEAAAIEGADLVLVCGGDGTVREVCAELAGTGIPVGIVPAGTGNLLARNLDIPLFLRAAVDVGLNGQDRAIDLVAVSGDGIGESHFMVMAGMGLDAAIMEGVNEETKKRIGWFAYVFSALKALMFPVVRLEISIDGGDPTTHRARTVVVGNVGQLQAGMPLLPDATIDDGLLDVVLLHPRSFWSWLPLVYRVLARRPRVDEALDRMTGRSVVVRASGDTPRQLDGDAVGPGRELSMSCVHGKLLVRVPR